MDYEALQNAAEKKSNSRKKKNNRRMNVSGKSVFALKKIISKKSKSGTRQSTGKNKRT